MQQSCNPVSSHITFPLIRYGVSGMGGVCHTLNPRLFADDIIFLVGQLVGPERSGPTLDSASAVSGNCSVRQPPGRTRQMAA